jgi:hypothetical protein
MEHKSEKYRRFAQECLELAKVATGPDTRAVLIQMAQVWFRLAEAVASDAEKSGD